MEDYFVKLEDQDKYYIIRVKSSEYSDHNSLIVLLTEKAIELFYELGLIYTKTYKLLGGKLINYVEIKEPHNVKPETHITFSIPQLIRQDTMMRKYIKTHHILIRILKEIDEKYVFISIGCANTGGTPYRHKPQQYPDWLNEYMDQTPICVILIDPFFNMSDVPQLYNYWNLTEVSGNENYKQYKKINDLPGKFGDEDWKFNRNINLFIIPHHINSEFMTTNYLPADKLKVSFYNIGETFEVLNIFDIAKHVKDFQEIFVQDWTGNNLIQLAKDKDAVRLHRNIIGGCRIHKHI